MSDQDAIAGAYDDTLKKLYTVLFDAYIAAKSDADKEQANQRFKAGVALARQVRDKAASLL